MTEADPDELIGAAEARALLAELGVVVDRATLSRWAKSGTLKPAHKLSGLRGPNLFRRGDVAALAAERTEASA